MIRSYTHNIQTSSFSSSAKLFIKTTNHIALGNNETYFIRNFNILLNEKQATDNTSLKFPYCFRIFRISKAFQIVVVFAGLNNTNRECIYCILVFVRLY